MKTHIEFFGIPGSGKSTLINPFIKSLKKNTIANPATFQHASYVSKKHKLISESNLRFVNKTPDVLIKKILDFYPPQHNLDVNLFNLFLSNNPNLAHTIYKHINKKSDGEMDRKKYSQWFYNLIINYQWANKQNIYNTLVFDEGFINKSITLFCDQNKKTKNDIETYINSIPQPDLIINVQVPVELAASRIRSANRSFPYNVSGKDHGEQINYLQKRQAHCTHTIEIMNDVGTDILAVKNTGSVGKTTKKLEERISNYFGK